MSALTFNTWITIYRENTDTDPWDPDYNLSQETATSIRASVFEQNSIISPEGEVRPTDISTAIGRVDPQVEIFKGDTILDQFTGKTWIVDEVATNNNPVMRTDKRLALRRTK